MMPTQYASAERNIRYPIALGMWTPNKLARWPSKRSWSGKSTAAGGDLVGSGLASTELA